ncbi:MAG: hypothetical protein JRN56_03290 [Nitrososphaerota archaeon]|nr:hypothetical protein [Nitrososphaerota archaeon]MDG7002906.1 hypothetical protein [Nitrososphaerota archaeon]
MVALAVIGLGLVIGAQLTPGENLGSNRPAGSLQPDIYFLIPTTASVSISVLNGTATLIVAQLAGDLSNSTVVSVPVVEKDIVTFSVPARGYYAVDFLGANGHPAAVTYTMSEGGRPLDVTLAGSAVLAIGLIGIGLSAVVGRRKPKPCGGSMEPDSDALIHMVVLSNRARPG